MTAFRDLALSDCDGRATPLFCSGLSVASRFPFEEKEFNSYNWHGDAAKSWIDGEYLAKKVKWQIIERSLHIFLLCLRFSLQGVGRVRVRPMDNVTLDVFITHTAADPDPSHGYNNSYYRVRQVRELVDVYLNRSTADVMFLGGDFNAGPENKEGIRREKICGESLRVATRVYHTFLCVQSDYVINS